MLSVNGNRTVDDIHRELGKVLWDNCGMARTEQSLIEGALGDPRDPRGVLEERARARRERDAEPVAREGRARRRLPRVRRADGARRAAPQRELRRPLPRGVPDRRRRGAPRRRALQLRRGVGVQGCRHRAGRCTRSRSSSSTPTPRPVRTSKGPAVADEDHAHHPHGLAPGRARRRRRVRDLRRAGREPRHVVPRDARHRERAAHARRQGADRVRPRLPRGHLRFVRDDDQRRAARPRARHGHVPAAHAQVPRRRPRDDRAVARRELPARARPHRRPQRVRPDHRVGRLRVGADRRRARRQPHPDPEGRRRRRDGRGRRASAAARASPRARTAPRSCSPRRSCSTST